MKTDLTKLHKSYYSAARNPEIATLGPAGFVSICGSGDPSGHEFSADIQALYSTAYALKFICKEMGNDFVVPKLEGLWWYDETRFAGLSTEDAPSRVPRI